MCRIAGLIKQNTSLELLSESVTLMCDSQKHGGPDDFGLFTNQKNGLVFGHRRLSIIDLSNNGHQPMADVDNCTYITFNGEIYNYQILRNELNSLGAKFKSETDTEVILQAYLHWDTASFSKLRGIFAFGLFDESKQKTYLVRDSKGVKPLYYCAANNALAFASEVRAFKAGKIAVDEDPNWPIRFLAFGNIPEPFTTLKDVYSLPASHYLCWDHQSHTYNLTQYKTSVSSTLIIAKQQAHKAISTTFSDAVKQQLIADAPIGVFLSGGIDSSLVALLANQQKHSQLNTVSIHFSERAYDESRYQSVIQNKVEGQKFSHLVRQADFDESFEKVMQAMDMPTTDGINTWFISYFARQDGLKAVLSGIGGDELFGGYPSFKRIKYMKHLRKLPQSILSLLATVNNRFKKITYLKYNHYLADYLFLRAIFSIDEIAQLLNIEVRTVAETLFGTTPDLEKKAYDASYASWLETNLYMQNQLLRDTDVMGMNHGIEIRVPFLDEDFCDLIDHISPKVRFTQQPKRFLIDSFTDLLPASIWDRPKMGFSFPLQQWLKQSPIVDQNGYKSEVASNIIQQFITDGCHWSKAFALYQVRQYV